MKKEINPLEKARKRFSTSFLLHSGFIVFIALTLHSCEEQYYGNDGREGDAFLSLTWASEMPEYLDAGTGVIPPAFKWGEYYKAYPGNYMMYYEGSVWNGFGWTYYAYEVEYEIWINPGEPGQPYGIDGRDGADTFLSIECSPYGPFIFATEKSGHIKGNYEILENNDERVKVLQKAEKHSMTIIYKKSVHSKLR